MGRPPRSADGGFSGTEIQSLWGLASETTATRAREMVIIRWNILVLTDAARALQESVELMPDAERELAANLDRWQAKLKAKARNTRFMTPREEVAREAMLTGRLDRGRIHPTSNQ